MMMQLLKAKEWRGQPFRYAHVKWDGNRLIAEKNAVGRVHLYSSNGIDLTPQLRHLPLYAQMLDRVPTRTALECELFSPGRKASVVKHFIAEGGAGLQAVGFAAPIIQGTRQDCLSMDGVADVFRLWGIPFAEYLSDETLTREYLLQEAQRRRIEGWVLKQEHYVGWYKLKVERTLDAPVTGFKDGDGKYLGLVGALHVSLEGHEIACVGGMDDETRLEIDEKADLGRVVEVAYQYVGDKGRLRHPRFVRWRDDKPAVECKLDQDAELEGYYT
jgi:ATP-dependent DNA ligase